LRERERDGVGKEREESFEWIRKKSISDIKTQFTTRDYKIILTKTTKFN